MKKLIASLFGKKTKRFFTKKDIETLIEQVQVAAVEEYKESTRVIDLLEQQVKAAGIKFDCCGWHEDKPAPDDCKWLNIKLPWVKNKRYIFEMYFVNNATTLDHVSLYKEKREYVQDGGNLITQTDGRDARRTKERELKKEQENAAKPASGIPDNDKRGFTSVTINSRIPVTFTRQC